MSSVGLNTLEGLATYLRGPQETQVDSSHTEKGIARSYLFSTIQAKVIRLEELRMKGLALTSASIFFALVISMVVAGLHFSHPGRSLAWGLFYGRLGACGTCMLVGIAIASVSHWKLKKKLSNEEVNKLIQEEESAITRFDTNLREEESRLAKKKMNFSEYKNKIQDLTRQIQSLNKPAQST